MITKTLQTNLIKEIKLVYYLLKANIQSNKPD